MLKNLANAGRLMAWDLAATFLFLAIYLTTKNIVLAVSCGMVLGVGQIGSALLRKQKIDAMQWLSLGLVLASGTATLLTQDPRFIMLKPSAIYVIVGAVMLKPGWMNRYMPQIALDVVGDVAKVFGFAWAGLMFASAGLNIYVALHYDPATWAAFMSGWGIVSKAGLGVAQAMVMRRIGVARRLRANPRPAVESAV